jgi:hypothetical protein
MTAPIIRDGETEVVVRPNSFGTAVRTGPIEEIDKFVESYRESHTSSREISRKIYEVTPGNETDA